MNDLTLLILICMAMVVMIFGSPFFIVDYLPKIKEKIKTKIYRFKTESNYNEMQKAFFLRLEMPCCGSKQYKIGPSGGLTTNIMCSKCGEKYNANIEGGGPPIIEKI